MRFPFTFWGAGGAPTPPTILTAAFKRPISVSFDGTNLWVVSNPGFLGLATDGDSHIAQIIDPTTPGVIAVVDLSAYSNGGEGIDGLNPAPVIVKARQVRSYGGYTFICLQGTKNLNDNSVSGFCVILDGAGTIVGHVRLLSGITTDRSSDCRAVAFDGTGNFFVAQRDGSFGSEPNAIHKFSIAAVLSAYPSYGTPTLSHALVTEPATLIEDITYGDGYVWVVHGVFGDKYLHRIDAVTGAETSYAFSGGHASFAAMSVTYAFGSVWCGGGDALTDVAVLRFDPGAWPSAPTEISVTGLTPSPQNGGSDITSDGSTIWYSVAGDTTFGNTLFRFSTGVGTEGLIASVTSPDINDKLSTMVFDGTYIWAVARSGSDSPGLVRVSTGLGTETLEYSIYDGDRGPGTLATFFNPTHWFRPSDYINPGATVYPVPYATWPDHSGITLPDHSGDAIGFGNGRDLVSPYAGIAIDPPAVGGLPSVSGTNFSNVRSLQNLNPLGEWFGLGEHHYFGVFNAAIIDDLGFPNEYQKVIGDASAYTGLYARRSGAGPYQYWARMLDDDGTPRVAEVEITSIVDAAGAGQVVLQGKKYAGYVWVRAGAGAWVQGDACSTTNSSAVIVSLQMGYIWGAYDNVNPCLLRAGATWRRALSNAESDDVATYGATV